MVLKTSMVERKGERGLRPSDRWQGGVVKKIVQGVSYSNFINEKSIIIMLKKSLLLKKYLLTLNHAKTN